MRKYLLLRFLLSIVGFIVLGIVFLSPFSIEKQSDNIQQEIDKVFSESKKSLVND